MPGLMQAARWRARSESDNGVLWRVAILNNGYWRYEASFTLSPNTLKSSHENTPHLDDHGLVIQYTTRSPKHSP
jgi:hypothetical protein